MVFTPFDYIKLDGYHFCNSASQTSQWFRKEENVWLKN
jgi:hypothetical protein